MAVTHRSFIFAAFLTSVLCVLLITVSISSESWIVSVADLNIQMEAESGSLNYGLFKGQITLRFFNTPQLSELFMTCLPELNACAVSCKTEPEARIQEVRALANSQRPNPACLSITNIDPGTLDQPAVISFGFYVSMLLLLFVMLAFAVVSAGLAILNATMNPTEPIFGLPGCLWSNVITAVLGFTCLMVFGVYWAASGFNTHLAVSYVATGQVDTKPGLGYGYWLLLAANFCSIINVVLIVVRRYLLERDPPPPTIKVENHSDGTIFLY